MLDQNIFFSNCKKCLIKNPGCEVCCEDDMTCCSCLYSYLNPTGSLLSSNLGAALSLCFLCFVVQVWAFHGTDKIADGALEQMRLRIMTPEGETAMVGLLAGGKNGSLRCGACYALCI